MVSYVIEEQRKKIHEGYQHRYPIQLGAGGGLVGGETALR